MTEIKLNKRYKFAGDIMPKLLEIGFDLETAQDFLNSIKDADVVPRAEYEKVVINMNAYGLTVKRLQEVAREIFEEIEKILPRNMTVNGMFYRIYLKDALAELKQKYAPDTNVGDKREREE